LHRLGAISDRTTADGDDQVGPGLAGLVGGGNDRRARRVRGHLVEDADATRAHRLAYILDLAGFAVERPAHHQEGALGAEPVKLLDDGLRGMAAEHDLVHGAEYDTALVHACPPEDLFVPVKLAEEICGVMPEDRPNAPIAASEASG
jgi:hypothetical protein